MVVAEAVAGAEAALRAGAGALERLPAPADPGLEDHDPARGARPGQLAAEARASAVAQPRARADLEPRPRADRQSRARARPAREPWRWTRRRTPRRAAAQRVAEAAVGRRSARRPPAARRRPPPGRRRRRRRPRGLRRRGRQPPADPRGRLRGDRRLRPAVGEARPRGRTRGPGPSCGSRCRPATARVAQVSFAGQPTSLTQAVTRVRPVAERGPVRVEGELARVAARARDEAPWPGRRGTMSQAASAVPASVPLTRASSARPRRPRRWRRVRATACPRRGPWSNRDPDSVGWGRRVPEREPEAARVAVRRARGAAVAAARCRQ